MKPPLLLLLLVAGFVSCIPRERQETWDANDSLEPLSAVGDSGDPSLALSNVNPPTEDADQQLNSDGDADNNYQERNYLTEPNPIQTQEERKIKSSNVLSRSLRIFRYKQVPSRYKPARRRGYRPRYRVRGKPRQTSEEYGAEDYNNYQQDEEEEEEENNEMDEEDEDEYSEMDEEENYDDEEEKDGDDVADYDEEEEEEEEEEEDYQPLQRRPPKRLRGKLRRGKTGRRGRYRHDLEGHEDTKRGFKLPKILKPRKKNKETEINKNDTSEEYSDSDDDDETRPLLRGQRRNWKKASNPSRKDSRHSSSRDITKRGFFSKIKNMFKKKKPTPTRRRESLRNNDNYERDDGGYDNYGYEDDDIDSNRIYEDEETYGDSSEERLLPGKRKSKFLGFSRRYRNKRGDLNLLDRVLRNFVLLSSHLKENMTQSITTPPLGTLNEGLGEDQGKDDKGREYEEENEDEVKNGDYEEEVENEAQNGKNERFDGEYDAQDNENGEYEDEKEDEVENGDYDEEEEEENEAQIEKNERLDDEYDGQDNENDLGDEYEVKDEENGNEMGEYETESDGYEAQGQGIQSQKGEYEGRDDKDEGQSNEEDESDEDYDESDEDYYYDQ